jgi:hypothetical protein
MSHVLTLTDEQYETLRRAAETSGTTPDTLVAAWLDTIRDRTPQYYETEDWFRHLGLTEDQIAESARLAADDDADA